MIFFWVCEQNVCERNACDSIIWLLTRPQADPFVVPFVPISGTPLEHHPAPQTAFMVDVYQGVAELLRQGDLRSEAMSAGCAKCGACSALSLFEQAA